ncbi:MAG: histidine phosphatase family protein [Parvibaculaceae bacterium]
MSDPPTVYLVRHGETEWSRSGRHTGLTDLPLTREGEAQARALRLRLSAIAFDNVITSPLRRAARTAELAGFTATPDADLVEWDYGDYEGMTSAAIRAVRPGWDLFDDGCPGGESVRQMTERADRLVSRLTALRGNVLVFAHGHLLRVLAARWVGQPASFARALLLSTGSVSALGFGHGNAGEPAVSLWNS